MPVGHRQLLADSLDSLHQGRDHPVGDLLRAEFLEFLEGLDIEELEDLPGAEVALEFQVQFGRAGDPRASQRSRRFPGRGLLALAGRGLTKEGPPIIGGPSSMFSD